ncbi:M20 metallopeptidase family protein [Thermosediminibacter litoriperuensis]|uniref:Amidohydrolase n=1 Tax=Thermosediminibacter litoriperuensis TaxID=291989 RepID=A0A5S5AR97_9FIRM|nr:amidohydrolase [Thermosediminibacter litoriperuensis]TYP53335.1 amidohydrolase [Thermosediminibacter litoriperuensis]
MKEIREEVQKIFPKVQALRRDFHAHPELGFEEVRTSKIVAETLKSLGLEVQTGIAKTGVVGLLDTGKPGPTVALRADMDALPVRDAKKVPYASTVEGVCHACGHDGHTAMLLGAAMVLSSLKDTFTGKVKFIFQPCEEILPGGAKFMVEAGVLENPKVDNMFGLHLWTNYPAGTVGLKAGPFMAAVDSFTAEIIGKGGHGSAPHETVDAVVVAAQVVTALQTIVSRSVKPSEPAVVSVGTLQAGYTFNIIADIAKISGTVRSYSEEVRTLIQKRMEEILKGITGAYGADYRFNYTRGYPAVITDEKVTGYARQIAAEVVGAENVIDAEPVMGSEDFAYYLQKVPGTFAFVGAKNEAKGIVAPHHHPEFDIDEDALAIGVELFASYVLNNEKIYNNKTEVCR